MSTTLPSQFAHELIVEDLRRKKRRRRYEFVALLLTLLAAVGGMVLLSGIRDNVDVNFGKFVFAALWLTVAFISGLWLVFATRGRPFAGWMALLVLGLPVAVAAQMWGVSPVSVPALAGLRCYAAIMATSFLATVAVMFWMVQYIPPQRVGKFGYFLFLGGVISLGGTLMIHLHCPVTSGTHLAWHVAAAWSGALVFGWLAMRFHRAWWLAATTEGTKDHRS